MWILNRQMVALVSTNAGKLLPVTDIWYCWLLKSVCMWNSLIITLYHHHYIHHILYAFDVGLSWACIPFTGNFLSRGPTISEAVKMICDEHKSAFNMFHVTRDLRIVFFCSNLESNRPSDLFSNRIFESNRPYTTQAVTQPSGLHESDVHTTELRTEYLFISIQS